MKLNIYNKKREIVKTYEVQEYELLYGTVEDALDIFDSVSSDSSQDEIIRTVASSRDKINELLMDIFPELTHEELRMVSVRELLPLFTDLIKYVGSSLSGGAGSSKN